MTFLTKMWLSILFTALISSVLVAAARERRWGLVTLLSGFLLGGLFAVTNELLWWMSN
jgi:hypothetical protein